MAAIVAGVALNRPARKTPWLLLAVAQLSFVAGQLSFLVAGLLGTQLPFPSFADVLYLATWIYLILPYTNNPDLSWLQKSVAVGYPLCDVLVLAVVARLLAPGSWRSRSVQLLTIGITGELVADRKSLVAQK